MTSQQPRIGIVIGSQRHGLVGQDAQDTGGNGMTTLVAAAARPIVHRTRGSAHGPIIRLMSPGDLGEVLKPFVFLDLFDHEGPAFNGPLHPHSGIATLTYVAGGAISYIDPDNVRGTLAAGGVEWMQAGRGMWHGGGIDKAGRTSGFQLWVALPPELELGPTVTICQAPGDVQADGPARVLLGSYGAASSAIESPSPINYLAVRLKGGERWRYTPPAGHTVGWVAVNAGRLDAGDSVGGPIDTGELAVFEESGDAIDLVAHGDTAFVLGSAVKHPHELVMGYYSVHTSKAALAHGEAEIQRIGKGLRKEGRLG